MINFANIPALIGLISLPIIFYIIRFYPPTPKQKDFSSLFLLKDIISKSSSKSKFPIWLLIFRLLICMLIILFFSDPFISNSKKNTEVKNYIIIADNSWSIANNWQNFKQILNKISLEAESNGKEVHIYLTSFSEKFEPTILNSNNAVLEFINNNPPLPQQTERKSINEILLKNNYFKSSKVFFIFSNLDSISKKAQTKTLEIIKENNPAIEIINPIKKITFIDNVVFNNETLEINIKRKGIYNNNSLILKISGNQSEILFKKEYFFKKDINEIQIKETFPLETINQFFKISILNENHAGSSFYLDDIRKNLSIGIVAETDSLDEKPLLSPTYYLKKSLNKSHKILVSPTKDLLKDNKSLIFLPSNSKLTKNDYKNLKEWVSNGGVLIRFADNKIVAQKDLYFDEKIYYQTLRKMATEFSLRNTLSINTFKKNTLFDNLSIPDDLIFKKQLLTERFDSDILVLASLQDQSPLITMKEVDKGKVILFHVTSNNEWSNLPLSGLFQDIINRLLLITKVRKNKNSEVMILKSKVNSFGELTNPIKKYSLLNSLELNKNAPSFSTPAGIYENESLSVALNLSGNLNTETYYSEIDEKILIKNDYKKSIFKLKRYILIIIFIMFFIDMLINIIIKKNFIFKNFFKSTNLSLFVSVLFFTLTININALGNDNYNKVFLAYIKSSDQLLNKIAYSGLTSLQKYLTERTSVNPAGVKEIDITQDKIFFYPLIYWQISKDIINFDDRTIDKIKNYLNSGGMILFDIISQNRSNNIDDEDKLEDLKTLFSELGISGLFQINSNHTLSKSYYLLDKYPGRYDNKILLIDTDNLEYNDGVSSIIVGYNHWAGAWAKDKNNYPLYQAVPGGERQRELSIRFGINLVMYALTGNYKSDQIHNKSILQRLERKK